VREVDGETVLLDAMIVVALEVKVVEVRLLV
jgi:hypothetical protein